MTLSRGIPELYLSSSKDVHVQATDPKSEFLARRRTIASTGVNFIQDLVVNQNIRIRDVNKLGGRLPDQTGPMSIRPAADRADSGEFYYN